MTSRRHNLQGTGPDEPGVDETLRLALRHAPDTTTAVDPAVRAQIIAAAYRAAAEPQPAARSERQRTRQADPAARWRLGPWSGLAGVLSLGALVVVVPLVWQGQAPQAGLGGETGPALAPMVVAEAEVPAVRMDEPVGERAAAVAALPAAGSQTARIVEETAPGNPDGGHQRQAPAQSATQAAAGPASARSHIAAPAGPPPAVAAAKPVPNPSAPLSTAPALESASEAEPAGRDTTAATLTARAPAPPPQQVPASAADLLHPPTELTTSAQPPATTLSEPLAAAEERPAQGLALQALPGLHSSPQPNAAAAARAAAAQGQAASLLKAPAVPAPWSVLMARHPGVAWLIDGRWRQPDSGWLQALAAQAQGRWQALPADAAGRPQTEAGDLHIQWQGTADGQGLADLWLQADRVLWCDATRACQAAALDPAVLSTLARELRRGAGR